MKTAARCPNFNHGRSNAPVRVCPMCGVAVNVRIPAMSCREATHGERRKGGDRYCVDCGLCLREP